ncbi:MAG: DUF4956 domain-containing protein [Lachnospiraceae bacterium]|nr:DUF4956 domain-containing protein [Lachnospiraceae bacterium]
MLESIFSQTETLTLTNVLLSSGAALFLGFIIACVYILSDTDRTKSFVITLTLLPALVGIVIVLVNGELGTSVAIVGAFSLVRFRSIPGSSKEIAFIFFAMAIGLAAGMGFITFAALMTVIISIIFLVLNKLNFGATKTVQKQLRVTIPEDLDYTGVFDDIFEEFTSSCELTKVKTTNMGSMFDLYYTLRLKDATQEKALIDKIRCRNGNLTIVCSTIAKNPELFL